LETKVKDLKCQNSNLQLKVSTMESEKNTLDEKIKELNNQIASIESESQRTSPKSPSQSDDDGVDNNFRSEIGVAKSKLEESQNESNLIIEKDKTSSDKLSMNSNTPRSVKTSTSLTSKSQSNSY